MAPYEFSLILAHAPHRWPIATVRATHPDLNVTPDQHAVIVRRDAPSLADAVVSAIEDLEEANLQPIRVCAGDWLTLADIAARIGRSREIVRLWSIGKQGPGEFPPPLNPGCDTRFFSWAEVSHWLCRRMGYDLPIPEPDLVIANLLLQARRLAPRVSDRERLSAILAPQPSGRTSRAVQLSPVGEARSSRATAVHARQAS